MVRRVMASSTVASKSTKVTCPSCNQPEGEHCVTKNGKRATFPHISRIKLSTSAKREQRRSNSIKTKAGGNVQIMADEETSTLPPRWSGPLSTPAPPVLLPNQSDKAPESTSFGDYFADVIGKGDAS